MATLTPISELTDNGVGVIDVDTALAAAVDTANDFKNDGNIMLLVVNGDASPHTVTVLSEPDPYGRGGAGVADVPHVVPAGGFCLIPFMNPAMFNSGGSCAFTLDAITSVNIGIYRMTKVR